MTELDKYWFPAKRFGWGWSFPTRWQGWLVLAVYAVGLIVLGKLYPPKESHAVFVAGVGVLTTILLAICWIKGEPPKWRSGGKR